MSVQLYAGIALRNSTPAIGGQLFGYRPDVFSQSVNDELTVTALALLSGESTVIFISCALCSIETALSDRIRFAVAEETGIPVSAIILSAFHTHSGPNTGGGEGWGEIDCDYCEMILIPSILGAASGALQNACPVVMGSAEVWSKAGINRREYAPDGNVRLGQNPAAPYDGNLTVVSFRGSDGKPVANIVHYGAHCTAAGVNHELSRDWAGVVIDRLEQETGAPVLFLPGAAGDTGPRLSNGKTHGGDDGKGLSYIYETGGIAAVDALRAFRMIKNYKSAGLSMLSGTLTLPRADRISLESAKSGLGNSFQQGVNLDARKIQYYREVVRSYEEDIPQEPSMTLQQTIVALGDIVFVPFPFEPFSEISLRLREYSPYAHTLCLGLTNGSRGYLPTQTQICLGGYEVEMFQTSSPWPLAENTDSKIITENLKLMGELKCSE